MTTLCLSMIVKDEISNMKKCLDSIKDYISYWVICDTGSTDGTQEFIKDYLKDIPGELIQHEWVDFATNRNMALEAARDKSDYIIFLDADDQFEIKDKSIFKKLKEKVYGVNIKHGTITFFRPHILKNNFKCKWEGVLHEYLLPLEPCKQENLEKIILHTSCTGNRSRNPNKYLDDAKKLEEAIAKEPNNIRYVFYCAQSYKDHTFTDPKTEYVDKAILYYDKRIRMGGWIEEQYISAIEIGKLLTRFYPEKIEEIESAFIRAYNILPTRVEALTYLSGFCREKNMFQKTYFYAKLGFNIKRPQDGLFIEDACYDWKIQDELAIGAFYLGKKQEAFTLNKYLLSCGKLPQNQVERINNNLKFCL